MLGKQNISRTQLKASEYAVAFVRFTSEPGRRIDDHVTTAELNSTYFPTYFCCVSLTAVSRVLQLPIIAIRSSVKTETWLVFVYIVHSQAEQIVTLAVHTVNHVVILILILRWQKSNEFVRNVEDRKITDDGLVQRSRSPSTTLLYAGVVENSSHRKIIRTRSSTG